MKDNTRYKDLCETKDGIIHEITAKNKIVHKMWKKHRKKKKQDCYAFNKQCSTFQGLHYFEEYCLTKIHIRQRRKHSPQKEKKKKPIQNRKNTFTNFTTSRIRTKKCKRYVQRRNQLRNLPVTIHCERK